MTMRALGTLNAGHRGGLKDLLRCGDIEPNPGPDRTVFRGNQGSMPAGREDFQLIPDLNAVAIRELQCPHLEVDGFASEGNRLCEKWWSSRDSAFLHNWHGPVPIWMNPPFRLLPDVVRHLQRHGGHALVLCPEWSEGFHALRGMARAAHRLPRGPMFRREGWDLLPPPRWDAWVFHIWSRPSPEASEQAGEGRRHDRPFVGRRKTTLAALSLGLWHGADKGRGASLLTCGDVESNPGPGARPGRSAGSFEHVLLRHLKQLGLLELLELEQIPPPEEGPCSAPRQQGISSSGWMVAY